MVRYGPTNKDRGGGGGGVGGRCLGGGGGGVTARPAEAELLSTFSSLGGSAPESDLQDLVADWIGGGGGGRRVWSSRLAPLPRCPIYLFMYSVFFFFFFFFNLF